MRIKETLIATGVAFALLGPGLKTAEAGNPPVSPVIFAVYTSSMQVKAILTAARKKVARRHHQPTRKPIVLNLVRQN